MTDNQNILIKLHENLEKYVTNGNLCANEEKAVKEFMSAMVKMGLIHGKDFMPCNLVLIDDFFLTEWVNYQSTKLIMDIIKPEVKIIKRHGYTIFNVYYAERLLGGGL